MSREVVSSINSYHISSKDLKIALGSLAGSFLLVFPADYVDKQAQECANSRTGWVPPSESFISEVTKESKRIEDLVSVPPAYLTNLNSIVIFADQQREAWQSNKEKCDGDYRIPFSPRKTEDLLLDSSVGLVLFSIFKLARSFLKKDS